MSEIIAYENIWLCCTILLLWLSVWLVVATRNRVFRSRTQRLPLLHLWIKFQIDCLKFFLIFNCIFFVMRNTKALKRGRGLRLSCFKIYWKRLKITISFFHSEGSQTLPKPIDQSVLDNAWAEWVWNVVPLVIFWHFCLFCLYIHMW